MSSINQSNNTSKRGGSLFSSGGATATAVPLEFAVASSNASSGGGDKGFALTAPTFSGGGAGGSRQGVTTTVCYFLTILALALGAAALNLALQTFRPPVWLDSTPQSPWGYFYGGAVYQGSGMWITNKPVLPSARSDLVAVSVSNMILLLGGADANLAVLDQTLEFDPIFERYNTSRASMPAPRYRHGGAAIGNKVYIVGGVIVYDGPPTNTGAVYDVLTDVWTAIPSMSLARCDVAVASLGSKLYVFGGYGVNFDMSVTGTLVEAFDPSTNAWSILAPMPTSRGDAAAVAFGSGRIFVMGGWNDIDSKFQTTTEAFSPAKNTWTTHAHMLIPKGDLATAVYRDKIFNVGGEVWSQETEACPWDPTLTCDINQIPTHDCISLDPDTSPPTITEKTGTNTAGSTRGVGDGPGVWVPHAPNPGARFRFAGAVHEASQAMWVFGGTKDNLEVVDSVSAFYDTDHPPVYLHYKN